MRNMGITAHGIKEIRIFRGEDDLDHLVRIVVVDENDNTTDISLFGQTDSIGRQGIRFPIKLDAKCDNVLEGFDISFTGDINEEE